MTGKPPGKGGRVSTVSAWLLVTRGASVHSCQAPSHPSSHLRSFWSHSLVSPPSASIVSTAATVVTHRGFLSGKLNGLHRAGQTRENVKLRNFALTMSDLTTRHLQVHHATTSTPHSRLAQFRSPKMSLCGRSLAHSEWHKMVCLTAPP